VSFIHWSDSETLFGLLVEYVADEHGAERDPARGLFLSRLRAQLDELQGDFEEMPAGDVVRALHAIRRSIGSAFESDDVAEHLTHCIEELERVQAGAGRDRG
jgi:hypothetical protein